MNFRETGLAVMVLLLYACAPEPPPPPTPLTATELRLRDSLELLRADYDSLRLWEALGRGRRLRVEMEAVPDSVGAEVRAEVYQYMAMLHFDRQRIIDSIGFFTEAALEILPRNPPLRMSVRQLLCASYQKFAEFLNIEQQLIAQHGRQLLESAGQTDDPLYPLLLVSEARGYKQHVFDLPKEVDRTPYYQRAKSMLRRAGALFRQNSPPWEPYALEQLGLLIRRDRATTPQDVSRFADTLRSVTDGYINSPFGHPDRFIGGWHWGNGRGDSATHYYSRLVQENEEHFQFAYPAEGYFVLTQAAEKAGRFDQAIDYTRRNMALDECCQSPTPNVDCQPRPTCPYYVNALASIHQRRYRQNRQNKDRIQAFEYSRQALKSYEAVLRNDNEEAVINETSLYGNRIIDAALRSATDAVMSSPTDSSFTAILQAMETGKALLFRRELFERDTAVYQNDEQEELMQLKVDIRLFKERFMQQGRLSPESVAQLVGWLDRRDRLERALRQTYSAKLNKRTPVAGLISLADVRDQLQAGEAFLEYSETEEKVIGLYIDRDTAMLLETNKDTVIRIAAEVLSVLKSPKIGSPRAFALPASRLYDLVLAPFAAALRKSPNLLIAPTVALNALPFAALVTGLPNDVQDYRELPYVIDQHTISYLSNWSAHRYLRDQNSRMSTESWNIGIWTNPTLDSYLSKLASGPLQRLASNLDHYNGKRCSAQTYLSKAATYDVIHLSVHAAGNPLRINANYFYLAPGDSLNGLVIGGQSLQARLVVLAACSTARGYAGGPEGTYSLGRSFHLAGVPDVVSSLYDLPAPATAALLTIFYEELGKGNSVSTALALAQRRCRKGDLGKRYVVPAYWAGLIAG